VPFENDNHDDHSAARSGVDGSKKETRGARPASGAQRRDSSGGGYDEASIGNCARFRRGGVTPSPSSLRKRLRRLSLRREHLRASKDDQVDNKGGCVRHPSRRGQMAALR